MKMDHHAQKSEKPPEMVVPQLTFSSEKEVEPVDDDDDGKTERSSRHSESAKSTPIEETFHNYYNIERGPILRIRSEKAEISLAFSKSWSEYITNPTTSDKTSLDLYFCDESHDFAVTPKCKDVKYIVLKNEGTTAIRFQWFRDPPNLRAQNMLRDPTEYKYLRLDQPLEKEEEVKEDICEMYSLRELHYTLKKKPHLEFHFSQLPGVILPGQILEFPILFRSKKPGYFHETLFLLTHPRVVTSDGRYYSLQLTGICTEIELAEKGNEVYEKKNLKRFLNDKVYEEEAVALMDSVLCRSLWNATNNNPLSPSYKTSLPNGRATAEDVFCTHNKDYYYHFEKSEKALVLVHQLTQILVPEGIYPQCDLSIQSMYDQVMGARQKEELNWDNMHSDETEDLLIELNECLNAICEPRVFTWSAAEHRKFVACYANMIVTFDDILLGFDRLYNSYNSEIRYQMDQKVAQNLMTEFLRNQMEQSMYWMEEDVVIEDEEGMEEGDVLEVEHGLDQGVQTGPLSTSDESKNTNEISIDNISSFFSESRLIDMMMSDLPVPEPSAAEEEDDYDHSIIMKQKPEMVKEPTVLTLEDTMLKKAGEYRRKVLTELRIKLFEEKFCEGLETMLSTVDCFNNMFDYRTSDIVGCIHDINC